MYSRLKKIIFMFEGNLHTCGNFNVCGNFHVWGFNRWLYMASSCKWTGQTCLTAFVCYYIHAFILNILSTVKWCHINQFGTAFGYRKIVILSLFPISVIVEDDIILIIKCISYIKDRLLDLFDLTNFGMGITSTLFKVA